MSNRRNISQSKRKLGVAKNTFPQISFSENGESIISSWTTAQGSTMISKANSNPFDDDEDDNFSKPVTTRRRANSNPFDDDDDDDDNVSKPITSRPRANSNPFDDDDDDDDNFSKPRTRPRANSNPFDDDDDDEDNTVGSTVNLNQFEKSANIPKYNTKKGPHNHNPYENDENIPNYSTKKGVPNTFENDENVPNHSSKKVPQKPFGNVNTRSACQKKERGLLNRGPLKPPSPPPPPPPQSHKQHQRSVFPSSLPPTTNTLSNTRTQPSTTNTNTWSKSLHELISLASGPTDPQWDDILIYIQTHPNETKIKSSSMHQWTPLHISTLSNPPVKIIRKLLDLYPQAIKMKDDGGRIPIHLAAASGASDGVLRLLVNEWRGSVSVGEGGGGLLALHMALRNEDVEVAINRVRILLGDVMDGGGGSNSNNNKEDVSNKRNPACISCNKKLGGELALHMACKHGVSLDVMELIMERYPDAIYKVDSKGCTPLVLTFLNTDSLPDAHTVQLLLGRPKFDGFSRNTRCNSSSKNHGDNATTNPALIPNEQTLQLPLHLACQEGCTDDILQLLINAAPKSVNMEDAKHHTPLHCALMNPNIHRTAASTTTNGSNHFGYGSSSRISFFLSPCIIHELLNEHVANVMDVEGRLPFHLLVDLANRGKIPRTPFVVTSTTNSSSSSSHANEHNDNDVNTTTIRNHPTTPYYHHTKPIPNEQSYYLQSYRKFFTHRIIHPINQRNNPNNAEFLSKLQQLPEWIRMQASATNIVQNVISEEISNPFPTFVILWNMFCVVLILISYRIAVSEYLLEQSPYYSSSSDGDVALQPETTNQNNQGENNDTTSSSSLFKQVQDLSSNATSYLPHPQTWTMTVLWLCTVYLTILQFLTLLTFMVSLQMDRLKFICSVWNWIDITVIGLLYSSLYFMGGNGSDGDGVVFGRLAMMTTGMLWMNVIKILKENVIGFAVFIGGILRISRRIFYFSMTTIIVIVAFAQIFFTFSQIPTTSSTTNSSTLFMECPFSTNDTCTIYDSYLQVYLLLTNSFDITQLLSYDNVQSNSHNILLIIIMILFSITVFTLLINLFLSISSSNNNIETTQTIITKNDIAARLYWNQRLLFLFLLNNICHMWNCVSCCIRQCCCCCCYLFRSSRCNDRTITASSSSPSASIVSSLMEKWCTYSKSEWDFLIHSLILENFEEEYWWRRGSNRVGGCCLVPKLGIQIMAIGIIPTWWVLGLISMGFLWPPQVRMWLLRPRLSSYSTDDDPPKVPNYPVIHDNTKEQQHEMEGMTQHLNVLQEDMRILKKETCDQMDHIRKDVGDMKAMLSQLLQYQKTAETSIL